MNIRNYSGFSLGLLTFILVSCSPTAPETGQKEDPAATDKRIRDQFVKANRQLAQKESDEMDNYARNHKMPFVKTSSGIRYFVYKPSAKGDSIRDSSSVTLDYKVMLLDGTLCYSSKESGKKTFVVGHEEIESGIHQGVQYLKKGDKALLLIPSPLAHGLLGDMDKIPPQMPILYDVEVN